MYIRTVYEQKLAEHKALLVERQEEKKRRRNLAKGRKEQRLEWKKQRFALAFQ